MTRRRPNSPPTSSRRVSGPEVLIARRDRGASRSGLQRIISSVAPTAPDIDFDEVQPQIYELLLLCDVITSYQLARFLGHGPGSAPTTRLIASRVELDEIVVGDELDDETWKALASWDLSAATPATAAIHLGEHLALADTNRSSTSSLTPRIDFDRRRQRCCEAEDRRGATPEDLDLALLPLAAEPVASDQPIEFVRIAGNVDSPASDRVRRARAPRPTQDRRSAVAPPRRVLRARLADQRLVVGPARQRSSIARCRARSRGSADAA